MPILRLRSDKNNPVGLLLMLPVLLGIVLLAMGCTTMSPEERERVLASCISYEDVELVFTHTLNYPNQQDRRTCFENAVAHLKNVK